MKLLKLCAVFCVSVTSIVSHAQVKTFILTQTNETQLIDIKVNEVVQVLFHQGIYRFDFVVNGVKQSMTLSYLPSPAGIAAAEAAMHTRLPVIAGPATMIVTGGGVQGDGDGASPARGVFTIRTTSQSDLLTPMAAVVIPSDAKGKANIILESSTNMVSWIAALPGTYGTSAQTRFFRVRAELLE